jgi:hypothetical protein
MVGINIFQKNSSKNPHNATCQILMDWWKMMLTWHYYGICKLVALELHNNCSYIVVTKLHDLHMYIVSHTMSCICCSSCNLFNNTHTHKKYVELQWIVNELQIVIATQKPSCKVSCKSFHFLIVQFDGNKHYFYICISFSLSHHHNV